MVAKDKKGQEVHYSYCPDCEYNIGGYYVEVYADDDLSRKIDDFCVHIDDCDCSDFMEVEKYIKNYIANCEFDLNFSF